MVHVSTSTAPQALSLKRSYTESTRLDGKPYRKIPNILSRILVAVMLTFTVGALPVTHSKGHSLSHVATAPTPFGGGKETVNLHQRFTPPNTLVIQHRHEPTERSVADMLCQFTISDQTPHVQVFHRDYVKPAYYVGRDFVEVVNAGIGQLFVDFGNFDTLTVPTSRTFGFPAQGLLGFCQLGFVLSGKSQISNPFAVTQRCQSIDTQINADRFAGFGERLGCFVQHQRDVIASGPRLADSHSRRLRGERARPTDFKFTNFGKTQNTVGILESRGGVFSTLSVAFALESGVLSPARKEVAERGLQVSETLLQRDATDLVEPLVFRSLFESGQGGTGLVVVDAFPIGPRICPQPQGPVPGKARMPKYPAQFLSLRIGGIAAKRVPDFHSLKIQKASHTINSLFVNFGIVASPRALALQRYALAAERRPGAIPPPAKAGGFLAGLS